MLQSLIPDITGILFTSKTSHTSHNKLTFLMTRQVLCFQHTSPQPVSPTHPPPLGWSCCFVHGPIEPSLNGSEKLRGQAKLMRAFSKKKGISESPRPAPMKK